MRKLIWLVLAISALAASAPAQGVMHGNGTPTSLNPQPNCGFSRFYVDDSTQILYISATGSPCVWTEAGTTPAYISGSGAIAVTNPNTYVTCTSTCTITPVAPSAGMQLCVDNAPGATTVITLAALGAGKYYSLADNTAYGTANHAVASGGALTDAICIVGLDSTHYKIKSSTGTWTD